MNAAHTPGITGRSRFPGAIPRYNGRMTDGLRERYDSDAGARAYARKYDGRWSRRLSSRREMNLVRWAMTTGREAGGGGGGGPPSPTGTVLDVPCAAGRLVPVLLEHADRVTAVDRSPAMVAVAREATAGEAAAGRVVVGEGDAMALAFADGAFDTVVCWRLLHHLTERGDRVRVLRELARTSRRGVVVTFADAGTWKARFQRWRRRNRRCAKLTTHGLASEARDAGLSLLATRRLSSLFSLLAAAVLLPDSYPGVNRPGP